MVEMAEEDRDSDAERAWQEYVERLTEPDPAIERAREAGREEVRTKVRAFVLGAVVAIFGLAMFLMITWLASGH
jgi:hypothetical protein